MDLIPEDKRDEVMRHSLVRRMMHRIVLSLSLIVGLPRTAESSDQCLQTIAMFLFPYIDLG